MDFAKIPELQEKIAAAIVAVTNEYGVMVERLETKILDVDNSKVIRLTSEAWGYGGRDKHTQEIEDM